jgi:hypothetical protein
MTAVYYHNNNMKFIRRARQNQEVMTVSRGRVASMQQQITCEK